MADDCYETFTVTVWRRPGLPLPTDLMRTAVMLGLGHLDGLEQLTGINLSGRINIEQVDGHDPYLAIFDRADPQETDAERLEVEAELHGRLTSPARLFHQRQ